MNEYNNGKIEFIPCKNIDGLYFILPDIMDFEEQYIAKYLYISIYQYRFKLAKEFNAIFNFRDDKFNFNKKEDCQRAIDWIYSMRVMSTLYECSSSKESNFDDFNDTWL